MNNQHDAVASIIRDSDGDSEIKRLFEKRLEEGKLTREENTQSHFCVFFAAYDPDMKLFFLGHHIKANTWIFNGGHIDYGETPEEAVTREIGEEWGTHVHIISVGVPKLLTIKPVEHPERLMCQYHFDIWYFIPVSRKNFYPDPTLLATEFYETGWKTVDEVKTVVTDKNTMIGIRYIEDHLF